MEAAAPPAVGDRLEVVDPARLAETFRDAVAAVTSASTAEAAVEAALSTLHERLAPAFVAALVVEHERLWLVGSRGYAMIPNGQPVTSGVVGRAVRTRAPQLLVDVAADPDYVEAARGVTSELAFPLLVAGEVVGILNLETEAALPPETPRLAAPLALALGPAVAAVGRERTLDLSALARLFVYLSSLRDAQEIAEIVTSSLGRVLPVDASRLCLRSADGSLEPVAAAITRAGGAEPPSPASIEQARAAIGPSAVIERVALSDGGAAVLLPLRANGVEIGVLVGAATTLGEPDDRRLEVASVLAAHAAAALDGAIAFGRERRFALTDPLTDLLNRRGFEEQLEACLARAQDDRATISIAVIDLDDFKEVNDRAGHEFGDALLREMGHVLSAAVPAGATAARLGGDEFVVLLPGADATGAADVAFELHRRVVDELGDAGFPLGASIGVATFPFDGGGASQLVRSADQALYEAKAKGRNRVVGFRELVRETASPGELQLGPRDRRGGLDVATFAETATAATSIWNETSARGVLDRLCKNLSFVVGATGCNLSQVVGPHLVDITAHAFRPVELRADRSYLIDDFPVTKAVLETRTPRAISFLDDDLDPAEAFVMRDLGMSCALLIPLTLRGRAWGLVELYDMRLRRYGRDHEAIGTFLVEVAARKLETLPDTGGELRALPLYRVPDSG